MARVAKNSGNSGVKSRRRAAISPEAREQQMISLAVDLAEKQLIEGTASAQVITHFLKLATEKERTEREILKNKAELTKAQTEAIKSAQRIEDLYTKAINAIKLYSGSASDEREEYNEY